MNYLIQFRYVNMGEVFELNGQEYTKTSFRRGFYMEQNKKIFKTLKKNQVVKTNHREFDNICY